MREIQRKVAQNSQKQDLSGIMVSGIMVLKTD